MTASAMSHGPVYDHAVLSIVPRRLDPWRQNFRECGTQIDDSYLKFRRPRRWAAREIIWCYG